MMFSNAVRYFVFQCVFAPVWAVWGVYEGVGFYHYTKWWYFKQAVKIAFDSYSLIMYMVVSVAVVGDTMLTNARNLKTFDGKKQRVAFLMVPLAWLFFQKMYIVFMWIAYFFVYFTFRTQVAYSIILASYAWQVQGLIFYHFKNMWIRFGVDAQRAQEAFLKCWFGGVLVSAGWMPLLILNSENEIKREYLTTNASRLVWDYGIVSIFAMGIFPGCCKLYSMLFLGDFTTSAESSKKSGTVVSGKKNGTVASGKKNATVASGTKSGKPTSKRKGGIFDARPSAICCERPITSYRCSRTGIMHIVQMSLKFRLVLSKLIFILKPVVVSIPAVVKDFYYSLFHFNFKNRPSMFVGLMREKRRHESGEQCWEVNDSPLCMNYRDSTTTKAKVWKVCAKYSVDWVPYWARVSYPFSFEYPFDAVRNLGQVNDSKRRKQAPEPCHGIRTAYYGCGSYMMRIGSLPAFCLSDTAGTAHYRRYLRATKCEGFDTLWTDWLLQESGKSMSRCVEDAEEYKSIMRDVEQIRRNKDYSDVIFPLGAVPMEQFVQLQFVICVFHERVHSQLYLREGVKISIGIAFIILVMLWIAMRNAVEDASNSVCGWIYTREEVMGDYKFCKCWVHWKSGMVGWSHVVKALALLSIDVCEVVALFEGQKSCVHPDHRRFVFEWGKVSKLHHLLTFHTNQVVTFSFYMARLLPNFALGQITGANSWDSVAACNY